MNNQEYGRGLKNLNINFSNTKPNQIVSLSGTYIDFHGKIHGPKSSNIIVQGGDDKGAFAVNSYEAGGFYMTVSQKNTIMDILKGMSITSDTSIISSNNGQLQEMCIAIYNHYCD